MNNVLNFLMDSEYQTPPPPSRPPYISVSGAGDLRGGAVGGILAEVKYFFFMF